jgi:hypothetical protein
MGEMGRTPKINQKVGRDHFGRAWSVLMAGAGLKTGQAIGSSTDDGGAVKDRPIKPEDLLATILKGAGINPTTEINPRTGRPHVANGANPQMVPGLLPIVSRTAAPVAELF